MLSPKFKVGQKVKVVCNPTNPGQGKYNHLGQILVIQRDEINGKPRHFINSNKVWYTGRGWENNYIEDTLQPIGLKERINELKEA